ncbi:MAG: MFS transporter [Gammaproteobacteria bacterium]
MLLAFGVGQTGAQIFRDTPAALLPLFMATVLGVAPWLAGIVVLIPKLWVIVWDPFMGMWSDRLRPRVSRRPFLVVGAVTTGATFTGLFLFSDFSSPWVAAIVVGIAFLLMSTAFSAFSVPYLALASELSDNPHERTKILAFRIVFTVAGVILGIGLAQPLVFKWGGDAAAWLKMAALFGALGTIAMLITAYGVPRNFGSVSTGPPLTLFNQFMTASKSKPFVILSSTYFIQSIAQSCGYAVVGFVFIFAIGDISLLLPFILVMSCGSVLSQPFWLAFSRRFGKVVALWVACLGWMAVTITWLWVGQSDDVLFHAPLIGDLSTEKSLVLLRAFLIGITNSGFSLLSYSLLTDTINYERQRCGSADEGLFSGIFTAVEKLAFALGPLVTGLVLSVVGFEASVDGVVEQSSAAVFGVVLSYSALPTLFMLLSLLVFTQYGRSLRATD